jgi:hypothetical protein
MLPLGISSVSFHPEELNELVTSWLIKMFTTARLSMTVREFTQPNKEKTKDKIHKIEIGLYV